MVYRLNKQAIDEECMSMLSAALRNLREAGTTLELHFLNFSKPYPVTFGLSQMERSLRGLQGDTAVPDDFWRYGGDANTAVELGLSAMVKEAFKPQALHLADTYILSTPLCRETFGISLHVSHSSGLSHQEAEL